MGRYFLGMTTLMVAASAGAVQLDLDNPNGIAALYVSATGVQEDQTFVVCTDGTGYHLEIQEASVWIPFVVSPVPLADLIDWTPWIIYTADGRWFARGAVGDVWEEMGIDMATTPPPCYQQVGTELRSLGDIKQLYR